MKQLIGKPNWVELEVGDVVLESDYFTYEPNELASDYKIKRDAVAVSWSKEVKGHASQLIDKPYTTTDSSGVEGTLPRILRRKPSKLSKPSAEFPGWWELGPDAIAEEGDYFLLSDGEHAMKDVEGFAVRIDDDGTFHIGSAVSVAHGLKFTVWRKMV